MRLANGIIIDKEKTFGVLKFSALRREVHIQNEDGTVSEEIKERTYDLKCKEQGRMIQVSIPASVPLKEFDYNAEVEIINPVADTVATATFQGADVDWYIKADDIVLKPEPYTLTRTLNWISRQVAPTWKVLEMIDSKNGTTYLKDILDHAKLTERHKKLIEQQTTSTEEMITETEE